MPRELTLYTTRQVADMFGVDDSTVRRWVAAGKVTPDVVTPGGHKRFSQAVVDRLMGTPAPDAEAVS